MVLGAIVVCEIVFWVFLAAGMAARYVLRRPRLGLALLLGSPIVDLALLALTAVDLHRGGAATQVHALAATYLGATVGFGSASWSGPIAGLPTASRAERHRRRLLAPGSSGWRTSGVGSVARGSPGWSLAPSCLP